MEEEARNEHHAQPSSSRRAHDNSKKPAEKNQAVNGTADAGAELSQEKDAAADAAQEMKKASIEDKGED